MTDLEQDGIVLTDEKGNLGGWIKASQSGLIGLAQAGIFAFTLSPASAVGSVASFFKAAGDVSADDPPGRVALGMVMAALLRTFHSCASEILEYKKPDKAQLDSLAAAMVKKLANGNHAINRDFFDNPSGFEFLAEFAKELPSHLDLNTTQAENRKTEDLLRRQFPLALDRVLIDQPNLFAPLRERLDNPASDAARRERERRLYQASLVKWYETEPLLGQQEESDPVLLSDVFIPLRCYTETLKPGSDEEAVSRRRRSRDENDDSSTDADKKKTVVKAHWLGDLIHSFVEEADPKNPVLMVSGGPGLGKSSSLRRLCAEFASQKSCFPVFLPLQLLESSGSLEARIHAALRTRVADHRIGHDLLSHIGEIGNHRTIVLMFDGLDELIQTGAASDAALRDFIQHVETFLNAENRNRPQARILAVITGRIGAADRASSALGLAGDHIAHLLPFCLKDEEKQRFDQEFAAFVGHDQRDDWWARWHGRVAGSDETMPDALKRDDLFELSREPLLLYFLVFVAAWKDEQSGDEFNRNTVYARILRRFHQRECDKEHSNLAKALRDYENAYEPVLQCLALAAWYDGSTRKGVISDVETAISDIGNGELQKAFRDTVGEQDPAFGASLAFHMKPTPDGKTFEFLHKSFAEYLVARRFVEDVFRFDDKTKPTELRTRRPSLQRVPPNLQDILREWLKTWGAQQIDGDLLRFICDEAKLSAHEIAECRGGMAVLLREAIAAGLPAHETKEIRRANRTAETFAAMTDWARNAEEALLVGVHGTVLAARAGDPDTKPQPIPLIDPVASPGESGERQPQPFVPGNMLARLLRQGGQGFIAHKCLTALDLSGAILWGANLGGADLRGADLRGAILWEADLFEANLGRANLGGVDLIEANLRGADLGGANLGGATLRGANLRGANLGGADLRGADLRGADLGAEVLGGADLGGAVGGGGDR
ncbi:pentapeptide repeat-containing protein, partial [uncultured Hoeflea sp.]|uniref:pentapeptide repeat-containing protein n=1 Tax=uncultured Hoeflea sp. TaxID=538666 RepID=UPI0026300824